MSTFQVIKDLELSWRYQWFGSHQLLCKETEQYNSLLKKQKPNNCLHLGIIDAVSLDTVKKLSASHDKIFLITEQNIIDLPNNVVVSKLPPEFYGCYYAERIPQDRPIEKDFNCFLNRIDPIRQTWFYLLFDRNLLNSGYVSFNMEARAGLHPTGMSGSDLFELYHRNFLSSFDPIKEQIKENLPFKNFIDNNDLFSVALSSKIGVIVETYFERTDAKTLSEKIFRALQLPRPWLLFAATGCVDKIRSMGFDVYDDIVDHSYDNFDTSINCVERQESILTQLSELTKLEFTPFLIERLAQGSKHNRLLLADWNSKRQKLCVDQIKNTFLMALEQ